MNNKNIDNILKNISSIRNNRFGVLKKLQQNKLCQNQYLTSKNYYSNLELLDTYMNALKKNNNTKINTDKNIQTSIKKTIHNKTVSPKRNVVHEKKNDTKVAKNSYSKSYNMNDTLFKSKFYNSFSKKFKEPLFNSFEVYKVTYIDPILFIVCMCVYNNFIIISDDEKENFIKDLKYKMGLDLDKENLYSKFNYNKKRFKKHDFQNRLINNDINIGDRLYCYLADYFGINIIKIDNDRIINNYNDYSSNRHSIILHYYDNLGYIIQYNYIDSCLVEPSKWEEYKNTSNFKKSFSDMEKTLNKMKLLEVQRKATELNISLEKDGKKGKKKKTKKELINEIKSLSI